MSNIIYRYIAAVLLDETVKGNMKEKEKESHSQSKNKRNRTKLLPSTINPDDSCYWFRSKADYWEYIIVESIVSGTPIYHSEIVEIYDEYEQFIGRFRNWYAFAVFATLDTTKVNCRLNKNFKLLDWLEVGGFWVARRTKLKLDRDLKDSIWIPRQQFIECAFKFDELDSIKYTSGKNDVDDDEYTDDTLDESKKGEEAVKYVKESYSVEWSDNISAITGHYQSSNYYDGSERVSDPNELNYLNRRRFPNRYAHKLASNVMLPVDSKTYDGEHHCDPHDTADLLMRTLSIHDPDTYSAMPKIVVNTQDLKQELRRRTDDFEYSDECTAFKDRLKRFLIEHDLVAIWQTHFNKINREARREEMRKDFISIHCKIHRIDYSAPVDRSHRTPELLTLLRS